ncbi:MAG: hypothetical protein SV375_14960, partial [Thermodesulfobacteriota bacterium]|nr:hypothetical protein [Thermodesulfobacteriota bacterium]
MSIPKMRILFTSFCHLSNRSKVLPIALHAVLLVLAFILLMEGTGHAAVGDVRLSSADAFGAEGNEDHFHP